MTDKAVIIWREAMQRALDCVPHEIQEDVLKQLVDQRAAEPKGIHLVTFSELMKPTDSDRLWNPISRATSVVVQTLVRHITNSHSPEGAAAVLFREHRERGWQGGGSGFLPDYLDGLPGLTVDRGVCVRIATKPARNHA